MLPKRLSILVAASLLSANAMASDNFNGWYLGANAGYSNGTSDVSTRLGGAWANETAGLQSHVANQMSTDLDVNGSQFGFQLGYDRTFGNFLVGGELSYNDMDMDKETVTGVTAVPDIPSLSYNVGHLVDVDDEIALRVKLGYAGHRNAVYGTLGAVRVGFDRAAAIASNGGYLKAGADTDNQYGVQFGIGYEFSFGNSWSMRAEVLRTNVSDDSYMTEYLPGSTFVDPVYTETVKQDLDYTTFRLGVNYRF